MAVRSIAPAGADGALLPLMWALVPAGPCRRVALRGSDFPLRGLALVGAADAAFAHRPELLPVNGASACACARPLISAANLGA